MKLVGYKLNPASHPKSYSLTSWLPQGIISNMNVEVIVKPSGSVKLDSVESQALEINHRLPPIHPLCEAIAVIPVYREFYGRGRIVDLLQELRTQSIDFRRLETILVVNNPSPLDAPEHEEGFVDNFRFLKYLDEQKGRGYFPNVYAIDGTEGQIPKRHMGLVRGLGQLVAEDRLDQTERGKEGVIIQLDADVSVTPDFVAKLLEAYQKPRVYSAMIGRIPLPIDFPSDDYYLHYAIKFAQTVASGLIGWVKFQGDGPTLSFRAFLHKEGKIREYMEHPTNEDFTLGDALLAAGQMYLLAEPRVYKGDRIRPDGFDSAIRKQWPPSTVISSETPEVLIRNAFKGLPVFEGRFQSMPPNEFWQMVVVELGQKDPQAMSKLRWYLIREEELARRYLDWDHLNPLLRDPALHIYALSRLAMGEHQMLPLHQ